MKACSLVNETIFHQELNQTQHTFINKLLTSQIIQKLTREFKCSPFFLSQYQKHKTQSQEVSFSISSLLLCLLVQSLVSKRCESSESFLSKHQEKEDNLWPALSRFYFDSMKEFLSFISFLFFAFPFFSFILSC